MIIVGILVYPQVEELDFIGPFEVLSYINKLQPESTKVMLIAKSIEPVQAYNGLKFIPDITMEDCPTLDVLVLPGGKGRMKAMHDTEILDFIVRQSKSVQFITSVCTGAFILAETGMLAGKRATTYHTALEELKKYPDVSVEKAKVVCDGKIITAAGVSSGIELGLYLLILLFGRKIAQQVADSIEYKIDIQNINHQ